MFIENFTKFIKYYGKGKKIKLFVFFILSLIAGLLEFCGIALIYPFILLIISPKNIIYTKYYYDFANWININNILVNTFILGLIIAFLFLFKNFFMIFITYLQNKFISSWKFALNKKFIHYYLFSTYKNSLKTTASEKLHNLIFLIDQTLDGFIFRIMHLGINFTIIVMILCLLFIKFPFAAIVTGSFIILSMFVYNKIFKKKTIEISQKFLRSSIKNNEKTMENINNIKEIKILSAENYFLNDYLNSKKEFNKVDFSYKFLYSIPQYIIEMLIVIALIILAGIISFQNIEDSSLMITYYAIIAAALFRIAPALNRVQTSLNAINSSRDFVKTMITEYENNNFDLIEDKIDFDIEFKNSIKFKNIFFSYKKEPVIKDLYLEIKKGEFIGIVGASGAGKSTLADIIMGLLPADSGTILVDDFEFNQRNYSAIRKIIGYVPQQINILDGSFKRNIAWGIEEKEIDEHKVIEALKNAQIYDFVVSFEEGINSKSIIGPTGLSQGQKQRLAIARALYRNPQILILDEATSSLDVETENEITKMLNSLKGEKTIIAIAHRLSTLKSCDRIVYLKSGRVIDTGSFEELSQKYPDFERLIKLSKF